MISAIGIIELSSIAAGFEAEDAMLKAASVEILIARTICSGKFLVIVAGDVAAVQASLAAATEIAAGFVIETLIIPNVDQRILPALSGTVELPKDFNNALGIIETFAVTNVIAAADVAVKAASVILFRVHVAMAIGGKGFLLLCGDVSSVQAAVDAGTEAIKETGMVVNKVVIPSASMEVFRDYI